MTRDFTYWIWPNWLTALMFLAPLAAQISMICYLIWASARIARGRPIWLLRWCDSLLVTSLPILLAIATFFLVIVFPKDVGFGDYRHQSSIALPALIWAAFYGYLAYKLETLQRSALGADGVSRPLPWVDFTVIPACFGGYIILAHFDKNNGGLVAVSLPICAIVIIIAVADRFSGTGFRMTSQPTSLGIGVFDWLHLSGFEADVQELYTMRGQSTTREIGLLRNHGPNLRGKDPARAVRRWRWKAARPIDFTIWEMPRVSEGSLRLLPGETLLAGIARKLFDHNIGLLLYRRDKLLKSSARAEWIAAVSGAQKLTWSQLATILIVMGLTAAAIHLSFDLEIIVAIAIMAVLYFVLTGLVMNWAYRNSLRTLECAYLCWTRVASKAPKHTADASPVAFLGHLALIRATTSGIRQMDRAWTLLLSERRYRTFLKEYEHRKDNRPIEAVLHDMQQVLDSMDRDPLTESGVPLPVPPPQP